MKKKKVLKAVIVCCSCLLVLVVATMLIAGQDIRIYFYTKDVAMRIFICGPYIDENYMFTVTNGGILTGYVGYVYGDFDNPKIKDVLVKRRITLSEQMFLYDILQPAGRIVRSGCIINAVYVGTGGDRWTIYLEYEGERYYMGYYVAEENHYNSLNSTPNIEQMKILYDLVEYVREISPVPVDLHGYEPWCAV